MMKTVSRGRIVVTIVIAVVALVVLGVAVARGDATLTPNPKFTAMDSNGNPYAGGKLYTYLTNTTTPKTTWNDSTKASPNTNPVILDIRGQADVWVDTTDGNYRFRLLDENDTLVWTVNDVSSSTGTAGVAGEAGDPGIQEILGDGTAGRVIRKLHIRIRGGTVANSVKVIGLSEWNATSPGVTDNIVDGTRVGDYWLSYGSRLAICDEGIDGTLVMVLAAEVIVNGWGAALMIDGRASYPDQIELNFKDAITGNFVDFTTLGSSYVEAYVLYLTAEDEGGPE